GDVGDDELPIVEPRDAEVGDERGERIVGDLRSRAGERREERRLARVRQTGEAHVRQELELEPDLAALAFATVLGDPRRAAGAAHEPRVALAGRAAARDHELPAWGHEVGDPPPRRLRAPHPADRAAPPAARPRRAERLPDRP